MENVKVGQNLIFEQVATAIRLFSPQERLILSDIIWEENTAISIEHQILTINRRKKSISDPTRLLDWDLISDKL